jgi:hypothetical protein
MDRRYYLAKLFLILVAIGLALAGGRASSSHMARALRGHNHYSAPAQVQDAAWQATANAARALTCLVSRTLHNLA